MYLMQEKKAEISSQRWATCAKRRKKSPIEGLEKRCNNKLKSEKHLKGTLE